MTPNLDQVLMIIRWLLSVGGPIGAALMAHGVSADQVTALQGALITIVAALPPVISFVWGLHAHTDSSKLRSVEAMSDVTKIEVKASATDGVANAANNPARPKVTTQ